MMLAADHIQAGSPDPKRIEHTLDGMLSFCFDPAMLLPASSRVGPYRLKNSGSISRAQ